jgi:hypothetical protein
LGSPEQTAKAKRFIDQLIQQSEAVQKVFFGLISAWQEQVEMPKLTLPNHEWFAEIEAVYKPLADKIFFAKDR